ncbi:MAG: L,D-transpeptidase family protein [Alphaproteobacteria bacterium]|nr:L,D-transpeptidase family protein [Alphaproteobacteria bacterium]
MRFAFLASLMVLIPMTAEPAVADVPRDDLADRFSRNILSTLNEDNAADLALLTQFYVERDMKPVWVNDEAPTERARDLLHILEMSTYDGLNANDYDVRTIRRLIDSGHAGELAELDLRLSLSLMQFLSDLGSGRTEPSVLDPELFVYPQDIDKTKAIKAAAEAENIGVFVGGYRPRQMAYWRLKGVLANYRAMARAGGWPKIDPGPLLKEGDRSPRVTQLRARLSREGDLTRSDDPHEPKDRELFDQALAAAVDRFQERHGLERDGRVGPRTLEALNTSIEQRIEQLVLNLERRRWMADSLASRYIYVNLADFHLQLVDRGEVVFDTPVVIGSLYNKTPVFSADMTHLVINPYWNVPPSIAKDELLSKAKSDPDYFRKNGFDLFENWSLNAKRLDPANISWSSLDPKEFGYKLRQRPGPTNALGRLKFMLPNDYNIYLHDTPDRTHFDANERSSSHGCVRVADPEALASAILSSQADWTLDEILNVVESGERKQVNLRRSLPVQITYLTAWVDDDNRVHFRNDVYDRDQILADALTNNPRRRGLFAEGTSTEAHLQAIEEEGLTAAQ